MLSQRSGQAGRTGPLKFSAPRIYNRCPDMSNFPHDFSWFLMILTISNIKIYGFPGPGRSTSQGGQSLALGMADAEVKLPSSIGFRPFVEAFEIFESLQFYLMTIWSSSDQYWSIICEDDDHLCGWKKIQSYWCFALAFMTFMTWWFGHESSAPSPRSAASRKTLRLCAF